MLGYARRLRDREDVVFVINGGGSARAELMAQAADLPNKCKAFPLFCRTWLQDRDLPKEERFKQASAAWKSLTEESREAWNAKAKETQLAWK